MEAYYINPKSGEHYPTMLSELVQPPWGGSSVLNDPENDLTDPWGQPFQLQLEPGKKPVVYTNSPKGLPISQYGIGPMSRIQ
jgi:hypothetical protein